MAKHYIIFVQILLLSLSFGCTKPNKLNPVKSENDFRLPEVPVMLTDSVEVTKYIVLHYWDNYDFADTTFNQSNGRGEEIFINFTGLIQRVPLSVAVTGITNMMKKAEKNKATFTYFMHLTERYFYEPTSPTRNDELFIPALEIIISSRLLDDTHKIRPLFQLKMAQKNRIGTKTTDLQLILTNGKTQRIYDFKSEFVVLFFYNPGCHTCREALTKLKESTTINEMTNNKSLKIIAICTNPDYREWMNYKSNIPEKWINGSYNSPGTTLSTMYDLKASPTLYLLDRNKMVIFKDAEPEYIIDFLNSIK